MATKTFKIGEYCKGGIITAIATKDNVTIIAKEWDYSQGSNRGRSQSDAKEWDRLEVDSDNPDISAIIYRYLTDLTSIGWADKVINWIESNTNIAPTNSW